MFHLMRKAWLIDQTDENKYCEEIDFSEGCLKTIKGSKNIKHIFTLHRYGGVCLCVCMRVCARVCMRVRVHVRVYWLAGRFSSTFIC